MCSYCMVRIFFRSLLKGLLRVDCSRDFYLDHGSLPTFLPLAGAGKGGKVSEYFFIAVSWQVQRLFDTWKARSLTQESPAIKQLVQPQWLSMCWVSRPNSISIMAAMNVSILDTPNLIVLI